jgi:hypothetical protein
MKEEAPDTFESEVEEEKRNRRFQNVGMAAIGGIAAAAGISAIVESGHPAEHVEGTVAKKEHVEGKMAIGMANKMPTVRKDGDQFLIHLDLGNGQEKVIGVTEEQFNKLQEGSKMEVEK